MVITILVLMALLSPGAFLLLKSVRRSPDLATSQTDPSSPAASPAPTSPEASASPSSPTSSPSGAAGKVDWDLKARSVVFIDGTSDPNCQWTGSGTSIIDGSYVLTNAHVAISDSGVPCQLFVGSVSDVKSAPETYNSAVAVSWDENLDLAVLRVVDYAGNPKVIPGATPLILSQRVPSLGEKLHTLSFPGQGGMTVTYSEGDFAGVTSDEPPFFKTTAVLNKGGSGGGVFLDDGTLVGVITAITLPSETEVNSSLGLIRPIQQAADLIAEAKTRGIPPPLESDIATTSDNSDSYADPRFGTCKEAKQNGYGPYYIEIDEEYYWYNDRDSDGIVCE